MSKHVHELLFFIQHLIRQRFLVHIAFSMFLFSILFAAVVIGCLKEIFERVV